MDPAQKAEWLTCAESPAYFLHHYGFIEDPLAGEWVPFRLWPAQVTVLREIINYRLVVLLKARQLGMTWLCLGFCLWQALFRPAATVLLFSRRDDEAIYLLADRLKGMYRRLPPWLQARAVREDNEHEWALSNGSVARAFPTSAGDSYTATTAIVDEADLVPDLNRLLRAVKPTIDAGGRMILLSRADKSRPNSEFKRLYRAARAGQSPWRAVFLPWHARPGRDAAWYAAQRADIQSRTGALDDLHEQYPATESEALAPRTLDKRLPATWLEPCYRASAPLPEGPEFPPLPGLAVYQPSRPGRRYVIGADPAEGLPTSDDSAATVLDADSGEEAAALAGKFSPATFAVYLAALAGWYNRAGLLVERNNHGYAVLLWLSEHTNLALLSGHDGRPGWHTTALGKALLYDGLAEALQAGEVVVHSLETYLQLASIEAGSLAAPEGEHDDRAVSVALAWQALLTPQARIEMVWDDLGVTIGY